MKNKLEKLYRDTLTPPILNALSEKEKLSAPLLLKLFDSYIDSEVKIMFVGKETNHWLTHQERDIKERGINYLLNDYEGALTALFKRYETALINNNVSKKSAFFSQYNNIKNQLVNEEIGSIVWNNLFKISYDQAKGFSKSSKKHAEIPELSKNIFLEELKILKPDIIIFVTGASYDSDIKDFLTGYETIDVPIKKRLWKFKYNLISKDFKKDIICYRTIHPHYYRTHNNEKDYYQLIIDDIKNKNIGKFDAI